MAGNYNLLVQMGNLTRDPELRYTPGGSPVTTFCIATNHKWKDARGKAHEERCYTDWECWGAIAETVAEYCQKGSCVMAEGRLKLDQWVDRPTGGRRSKLKGVASKVQFVSPSPGLRDRSSSVGAVDELPSDDITQEEITSNSAGGDPPF